MDFSDAFAAVLEKRRLEKELSRSMIAERAGRHQTYVGLVERGLRSPTLDVAKSFADVLGIPLSELVAEAEALYRKNIKTGSVSGKGGKKRF